MKTGDLAEKLEALADYAERRELEINTSTMRQAAARLRSMEEALMEIARTDVGGLQGIAEDHSYDLDDLTPQQALEREKAWHDEDSRYLLNRIYHRQKTARDALADPERISVTPVPPDQTNKTNRNSEGA